MVAYLLQPHTKRRLTPQSLLGKEKHPDANNSLMSNKEKLEQMWAKVEAQREAIKTAEGE